jgi:hypothetical protein
MGSLEGTPVFSCISKHKDASHMTFQRELTVFLCVSITGTI